MMQSKLFDHGYALLVGVGEHGLEPRLSLPVTVKDVAALHQTLTAPDLCAYRQERIQCLLNSDANNSEIIKGLNRLKSQVASDPEATVVIYYSGHGWVSPAGEYYLITQDTTPGAVRETALAATVFTSLLRNLRAERVLIVLDCCHAEGMAEAKGLAELDDELAKGMAQGESTAREVVRSLAQGTGRAVFSSSQGNEKSYFYGDGSLSVFTYHFIEALQGAGQGPGDTTVTIASLMKYVSGAVPATVERLYGKSQHPFFKFEATDFPVALIQGGKGLPSGGWEAARPGAERYLAQFTHQASLTGSGAIAQGAGAIAVGRGGVVIGGANTGSINTGTQISGDFVRGDKVLGDKIGKQINTGGGAFIGGNVDTRGGAFIGRDQIRGGRESAPSPAGGDDALAALLSEYFSTDELKRLAADLGFAWSDLSGDSMRERASGLVQRCQARSRLDEMKRLVRWARPHLSRLLD